MTARPDLTARLATLRAELAQASECLDTIEHRLAAALTIAAHVGLALAHPDRTGEPFAVTTDPAPPGATDYRSPEVP